MSAAQPQPESNSADVNALLCLAHPTRPAQALPMGLRALLPDPLASLEAFERFCHSDLGAMTPAQKAWEAQRIRTAAALVDDLNCMPAWLLARLEKLAA